MVTLNRIRALNPSLEELANYFSKRNIDNLLSIAITDSAEKEVMQLRDTVSSMSLCCSRLDIMAKNGSNSLAASLMKVYNSISEYSDQYVALAQFLGERISCVVEHLHLYILQTKEEKDGKKGEYERRVEETEHSVDELAVSTKQIDFLSSRVSPEAIQELEQLHQEKHTKVSQEKEDLNRQHWLVSDLNAVGKSLVHLKSIYRFVQEYIMEAIPRFNSEKQSLDRAFANNQQPQLQTFQKLCDRLVYSQAPLVRAITTLAKISENYSRVQVTQEQLARYANFVLTLK